MKDAPYVSTTNACKLCTPLGAALAFKGIEGAVPYLHGSQGCATYMRRYVISHFREPVDIASSALGEKHAIYGGGPNLKKGILNVMQKYEATVVGVATTCLTETIGDDVAHLLHEFRNEFGHLDLPHLVHVSTPSYSGSHMEGFHAAVKATVEQLATEPCESPGKVGLFPGFVSPADIRHLQGLVREFGLTPITLPDYSDTLDGPALEDYEKLPSGGTPVKDIQALPGCDAILECGRMLALGPSAGSSLAERFNTPHMRLGMPIGLRETDELVESLEAISGRAMPGHLARERGRLIDAYVDGHKYLYGQRAVVYGEEDLVLGLVSFLAEVGVRPVLVATGGKDKRLADLVARACDEYLPEPPLVRTGADFHDIAEEAEALAPDLMVGHSKGYRYAKAWNVPLVRVGFPIHDRFGGQRLLHVGYTGAQTLYDRLVNAVLSKRQSDSSIGYGYL